MKNFTLINETKAQIPKIDFVSIKDATLGKKYTLNLIFTTPARIKKLNTIYRNKEHATDILSFPISKTEGEMYISQKESRIEAKKFERTYENFLAFLFIHGCTHLKGYDHGDIMEGIEIKLRNKFKI
ncbi:MAG: rRNA maturation RNase YbeY [bacterium]|nr:rRNA maturation RNase YbeY [bacterium]